MGEFITDLGAMPINCLIFQDDIARLNTTMKQARTGETLAKKRLQSNYGKSKYVLLGSVAFKEKTRKEAQVCLILMGSHTMEESPEEKYLGVRYTPAELENIASGLVDLVHLRANYSTSWLYWCQVCQD